MFSFSIIIPVKSFKLTLNSNYLHLYRHKSGGGWAGLKCTAVITMLRNTTDYIVTVYTKLFTLVQT